MISISVPSVAASIIYGFVEEVVFVMPRAALKLTDYVTFKLGSDLWFGQEGKGLLGVRLQNDNVFLRAQLQLWLARGLRGGDGSGGSSQRRQQCPADGHRIVCYDLNDLKGHLPNKVFMELQNTSAWKHQMQQWKSQAENNPMDIDAFKELLKDCFINHLVVTLKQLDHLKKKSIHFPFFILMVATHIDLMNVVVSTGGPHIIQETE